MASKRGRPAKRVNRKKIVFFLGHKGKIAQDIIHLFDDYKVVGYDKDDDQDTGDLDTLIAAMPNNIEIIFHLANLPHPGPDWDYFYKNNVLGTKNVIEAAKQKGAKSIVFFSSLAAVGFDVPLGEHGEPFYTMHEAFLDETFLRKWPEGDPPFDEDTEPLPVCGIDDDVVEPYGCSKTAQEKMLLKCDIPTMILRLGPYCMLDVPPDDNSCYADATSRPMTHAVVKKILSVGIEPGIFHVCRPGGMWGGQKIKEWLDAAPKER